jgi:hypothetical protein
VYRAFAALTLLPPPAHAAAALRPHVAALVPPLECSGHC